MRHIMRHMRSAAILMVASAAFVAAQTDPPGRVGRLNYMDGPVSFQPAGVNDWVEASVNRPLIAGDYLWVGNRARTEVHVGSTALRLGANTAFEFLTLDDQTVQVRLSEGTLTVRMRRLGPNQIFEIDTPNVAFNVSRPGEYRIDANPDTQTTTITVRDGEGDLTGGGEAFPLYARQQVAVRGDDRITYNLASAPGPDSWDQWCSARDRREDQSRSARYVSREIAGYDDLDQYGRWDNQPGYGNVWMPTSVGAGWAPYRDGHWAWISPWGWTWVDDEPWGFAPYHYGRWASFGGRWGWIPGPYNVTPVYAPALVAWIGGGRGGSGFSLSFSIGTAAAVGWFPLGPREPYFPSYQASRGYFTRVNNSNTVINNVTINNYYDSSRNNAPISNIQYVNQRAPNGVTAVPQESFARGRRVTQDARPVPASQLTSAQVFGAPSIAPQRESVLGARADTVSRAARPPANVMSRPVVARTAPAPAPVAFDRQQQALTQNPGRPLPTNSVQQMRQSAPAPNAPVRVVDMGRVRRVQPTIQPTNQPTNQPAVVERQKGPPGRQQPAPQVSIPQTGRPQTEAPQPAVIERQRGRQQPPQVDLPRAETPRPPAFERQKGQSQQQQPQQESQQVVPPPVQTQAPPEIDRSRGRGQRQQERQQQAPPQAAPAPAPPPAAPPPPAPERPRGKQQEPPPPPPQAAPPAAEQPRQNKGKQNRSDREDGKGKSDR